MKLKRREVRRHSSTHLPTPLNSQFYPVIQVKLEDLRNAFLVEQIPIIRFLCGAEERSEELYNTNWKSRRTRQIFLKKLQSDQMTIWIGEKVSRTKKPIKNNICPITFFMELLLNLLNHHWMHSCHSLTTTNYVRRKICTCTSERSKQTLFCPLQSSYSVTVTFTSFSSVFGSEYESKARRNDAN